MRLRGARIIASSMLRRRCRNAQSRLTSNSGDFAAATPVLVAVFAVGSDAKYADLGYGAGAGVVAFHLKTTDAVVVLSDFLNPATGAFEKRYRYPNLSAR